MDLLASLNVEDLPEQQTRIQTLFGNDPDFDRKLGFDACCVCGKACTKIECSSCNRVKYCSDECRKEDSLPKDVGGDDGDEEEEERALGHTSVICALLGLCNDDEAVEAGDEKELCSFSADRRTAATDRVASEFESYPATLANVLMEGPCFQEALQKSAGSMLTIHVIGSSTDSELWEGHPNKEQERNVFGCYADALAEIAEQFKMKTIVLQFFGPECPKKDADEVVDIPPFQAKQSSTKLRVTTSNADYDGTATDETQRAPDVLVFFNPGFTCPDYAWEKTLVSCMKDNRFPFLVTTNTEMEALADMQYLYDREFFQDIPPALKSILENSGGVGDSEHRDDGDENSFDEDSSSFFSLNPYCGMRVRQSGTMANDLYVKSRWIFGGFSGPIPEDILSKKEATKSSTGKRKRAEGASANSKKANPALV
mmetsp:Transcript_7557/g.18874  ORF Transcript_7557/g.18874 Transcript_7557/m.18874 type:complete len:427 (+) Transcript_7557:101-1381(+)